MFLFRAGVCLSRAVRKTASSLRVFWAVVALTLAYLPTAVAAPQPCGHTVIASTGTAAPAGGNYFFFHQVAFAARDEVAFAAFLRGPSNSGVFLGDGATTSVVALGGNPDPAAGNLGFFISTLFPAEREIVVAATPFDPEKSTAVFGVRRSNASLLVEDGQVAPGGGSLSLGELDANSRGAVAYSANLIGGADTQGLFRTDRNGTVKIAGDNSGLPTGGTVLFFANTTINSRGQVAFFAGMEGGASDFGVFRGDGREITTIFAAGQTAPGGGTFVDFGTPILNDKGQVVVPCLITGGTVPSGLLLGDGKKTTIVALTGQPAPKGGNYGDRFAVPTLLDDQGQVVFNVDLTGGANPRGLFRKERDRTITVALQGAAAPGTTGTFSDFINAKISKDGTLAILARLTLGVGGVDTTNNMGIWVGTSESNLRLVARSGETIEGRMLARFSGQLDLNEKSVAWIGAFSDGTSAVVLTPLEKHH
ncbi:MAG: hypothetical protein QM715_05360 [Nibricoccus sp.]